MKGLFYLILWMICMFVFCNYMAWLAVGKSFSRLGLVHKAIWSDLFGWVTSFIEFITFGAVKSKKV